MDQVFATLVANVADIERDGRGEIMLVARFRQRYLVFLFCISLILETIQSGASSRTKHGGAYFLAVYGSIEDLMAAPEPYESLGPPFLGGSAQTVTFVLPMFEALEKSI